MSIFTTCVLCYGDYPALARRCLSSLTPCREWLADVRVGANEISAATRQYLAGVDLPLRLYDAPVNVYKYPLMRRMLYDAPPTTEFVMWLDDDSYFLSGAAAWLPRALDAMRTCDLAGHIWTYRSLSADQLDWIPRQPWYTGKPVKPQPSFVTGGWWIARWAALQSLDYPWPALLHNGGDVMLSVALQQQGLRFRDLRGPVAVNKHRRRGANQSPVGSRGWSQLSAQATAAPAVTDAAVWAAAL